MTVRGFEPADGRTVEHSQFGGFPEVGDLEAERQLADVLVGAAAVRLDGAQDVSDGGLAQTPLFDVRLDELRAVRVATVPVAFER